VCGNSCHEISCDWQPVSVASGTGQSGHFSQSPCARACTISGVCARRPAGRFSRVTARAWHCASARAPRSACVHACKSTELYHHNALNVIVAAAWLYKYDDSGPARRGCSRRTFQKPVFDPPKGSKALRYRGSLSTGSRVPSLRDLECLKYIIASGSGACLSAGPVQGLEFRRFIPHVPLPLAILTVTSH
jgi:hypothetical protein